MIKYELGESRVEHSLRVVDASLVLTARRAASAALPQHGCREAKNHSRENDDGDRYGSKRNETDAMHDRQARRFWVSGCAAPMAFVRRRHRYVACDESRIVDCGHRGMGWGASLLAAKSPAVGGDAPRRNPCTSNASNAPRC
jgi:hypothetical protein